VRRQVSPFEFRAQIHFYMCCSRTIIKHFPTNFIMVCGRNSFFPQALHNNAHTECGVRDIEKYSQEQKRKERYAAHSAHFCSAATPIIRKMIVLMLEIIKARVLFSHANLDCYMNSGIVPHCSSTLPFRWTIKFSV